MSVAVCGGVLRGFIFTCLLLFSLTVAPVQAVGSTLVTAWPVLDYRADEQIHYQSLHLFGPVLKHETAAGEAVTALRPLFHRRSDTDGSSQLDVLYPLWSYRTASDNTRFNAIHLLSGDFGSRESGSSNRFHLFPFLFYGSEKEQGGYFGFFPLGGTIKGWFGRDEITFALFPLYSRTFQKGRRTDNLLWPVFARISGEEEAGFKVWPLYGQSRKTGVYKKRFFLWPIFFSEENGLNTDTPVRKRAAWPLYISSESPKESYHSVLWPFFSRKQAYRKSYTEWNFLWPLIRVTNGETRHGVRFLPFYADETAAAHRNRWFGWPLYKIEETRTERFQRRRHRVLFFLYSDLKEEQLLTGEEKRRIAFWPLFSYSRKQGVSHLHLFSLLEPFFPENRGIEASWAPLWRFYQQKWDDQGNRIVSLFWNFYWQEKRGDALAWELFPLFEYRRNEIRERDMRFLKGLFHYHAGPDGRSLRLFYLPWSLPLGSVPAETGKA